MNLSQLRYIPESAMVEVCHTFAAHQLSKFATTQNKTNYKKDYIYFDTIEQTRIARAKKRQLVKTVSRKGAKLTFFNALRCVIASLWEPTRPVFAYNVPTGHYRRQSGYFIYAKKNCLSP